MCVSCKMPYQGWQAYKGEIIKIFDLLKGATIIQSIERYSMKYVNIIEGRDISEHIQRIDISLRIGDHVLHSEPFGVRLEVLGGGFLQLIQLAAPAQVQLPGGSIRSGVLVDVDTICNHKTGDFEKFIEQLPSRLEDLHTACKTMFYKCLTPSTIDYLEPVYD